MNRYRDNCGWKIRWSFLAVGGTLAIAGGLLTATIVGAIIGIPLLLIALPLFKSPVAPVLCT
jgi:hypothetical protein